MESCKEIRKKTIKFPERWRNAYDHLGRRVQKVTPEATHTYFYDGWMLIGGTQEQTDIGGAHNGKMYLREDRGDA